RAPLPVLRGNPLLRVHVAGEPPTGGRPVPPRPSAVRRHAGGHSTAGRGRRHQPDPPVAAVAALAEVVVAGGLSPPGRELGPEAHDPAELTAVNVDLSDEQPAV